MQEPLACSSIVCHTCGLCELTTCGWLMPIVVAHLCSNWNGTLLFASTAMSACGCNTERKYPVHDKELLALKSWGHHGKES